MTKLVETTKIKTGPTSAAHFVNTGSAVVPEFRRRNLQARDAKAAAAKRNARSWAVTISQRKWLSAAITWFPFGARPALDRCYQ